MFEKADHVGFAKALRAGSEAAMAIEWILDHPNCTRYFLLPNLRMLKVAIEWNRQDHGLPPKLRVSRKEKDAFLHILENEETRREEKAPPYSTPVASEEFCIGSGNAFSAKSSRPSASSGRRGRVRRESKGKTLAPSPP